MCNIERFFERCSTGKCNMEGEMVGNRWKFRDVFRYLRGMDGLQLVKASEGNKTVLCVVFMDV